MDDKIFVVVVVERRLAMATEVRRVVGKVGLVLSKPAAVKLSAKRAAQAARVRAMLRRLEGAK